MATLYKTDGTTTDVQPRNKRDFKLKELYKLLDIEMVQMVELDGFQIMLLDEEGKLKESPINHQATRLFWQYYGIGSDVIMGNVLVCKSQEFR